MSAADVAPKFRAAGRSGLATRTAARAQSVGVAVATLGGLLLALTFVISATGAPDSVINIVPQSFILANTLLYCGLMLRTDVGAIGLLTSFFFLFFVAIPAAVQIDAAQYPFGGDYGPGQLMPAYSVLSLGQISLMAGMEAGRRRRRRIEISPTFDGDRLTVSAYVLAAISAVVVAYIGVSYAVRSRVAASADPGSGGLRTQALLTGRSLSLLAALILVYLFATERSRRRRPSFLLALVATVVVFFILNFPSSLPRFQLLGGLLAFACVLIPSFKILPKIAFSVVAPGFLFLLFPAVKALGSGDGIDFGGKRGGNIHGYILSVDFDSFKQTIDTIIYVHLYGTRSGENLIGAALFWVPRSLWQGKPTHSGAVVSSSLGYSYTNVSSPFPAEGLIAFGVVGTVLLCFVVGLISGRIETLARESAASGGADPWVLAYALATGFSVILLRGALNAVFPMIGPGIVACIVVLFAARNRRAKI